MKLKKYLKENGLSEKDFAEILGVTQAHINYLVHGKKNPSAPLTKRIEEVTNGEVTFNDLFSSKAPAKVTKRTKGKK